MTENEPSKEKPRQPSIWKHPLVTALITFVVTAGAAVAVFYLTRTEPRLVYEVFPPSSFTSEERELSIQNLRIANTGDDEAEEVQLLVIFPEETEIRDAVLELSPPTIDVKIEADTTAPEVSYRFPLLNPGETVRFSFLVRGASSAQVYLRGKGVIGVRLESDSGKGIKESASDSGTLLLSGMAVGVTMTFFLWWATAIYGLLKEKEKFQADD